MIKNNLRGIILLMSLALLGLIVFQFFWIDQLIKGNEEKFEKNVIEALHTVATKLEKQEITKAFTNIQQLHERHIRDNLACYQENLQREANKIRKRNKNKINSSQTLSFHDTISIGHGMQVYVNFSQTYGAQNIGFTEDVTDELEDKKIQIRDLENQLVRTQSKYQQTLEVVENMMMPRKPIVERISLSYLDSLLKYEFKANGINLPYEYAISQKDYPTFIVASIPYQSDDLSGSSLKTSLFPNDVFAAGINELMVFFPGKKKFLRGKIWSALASSGVLALIILICFGYSIHLILQQKKLSEMKNDFINNMTHELKTPIATVSLAVEALNDKDIAGSLLRNKYLKVIGDENKRLSNQVEKVLQIAAMDKKDYQLKNELLDFNQLIDEAVKAIEIQVEQREGRISIIHQAANSLIEGDKSHLTNIISNLLDNANKYSPEAPNIIIRTKSDEKNIIISIQDHGRGMTKDQQKHIFEKFYRVPTGNVHDVKGFGLGLSYVLDMVYAHSGQITVNSELNKGSIFEIKLPLYKSTENE